MSRSNKIYPHTYFKSSKIGVGVYLDYAASALANSSSIHSAGINAKAKLQNSRREVADILGARPEEIIFTSGGTESNNLAIQGIVFGCWTPDNIQKPHIITTNIEHPSVLETFELLAKRKLAEITVVKVETNGIVDPKKIKKEIKKNTVLVSVMYANNEIGTIQPIKEIAKEIRHYKKTRKVNFFEGPRKKSPDHSKKLLSSFSFPLFHTDAVQAANYLDLRVEKLGVDLLSLSGSKIEGSGRVGVLYKRKNIKFAKVFGGGDQEGGVRPGTENLPEIQKFSRALKSVQNIKEQEIKRLTKLRDYFFRALSGVQHPTEVIINGDLKNRLPNNVNITIPNIPSDLLVIELSAKGIMASAKSACKSGDGKVSYVIKAINKNIKEEDGSLRFSLGRDTTKKDIDYTIKVLSKILAKLQKWYTPTPILLETK